MLYTLLRLFLLACLVEFLFMLGIRAIPLIIVILICIIMKHLVALIPFRIIRVILDVILFIIVLRFIALIFIIWVPGYGCNFIRSFFIFGCNYP